MAPKKAKAAAAAEDYSSWSVDRLKARLKDLGMTTSGSKTVLIERLQTVAAAAPPEPKAAPKRPAPKAAAEEEPAPKRGKAEAPAPAPEPEEPAEPPAPKRAAKAKAAAPSPEPEEPPAPKRGAAKAKAKEEPAPRAPPPKAKAAAKRAAREAEEPAAKGSPKRGGEPPKRDEPAASQGSTSAGQGNSQASSSQVYYEDGEFKADYAKSSRSTCNKCRENIQSGELRLGKMVASEKFDGMIPRWYHAHCFLAASVLPRCVDLISGFSSLKPADQTLVLERVPRVAAGDAGASSGASNSKLQAQSQKIHEVLDALSDLHDEQIKEMCELNDYPTKYLPGGCATLRELCADGILFGRTKMCEVCNDERKGNLLLSGERYKCRGSVSEYLRCSVETQTPEREKWELTPAAKALGRGKLAKKLGVGERIFSRPLGESGKADAAVAPAEKRPPFLDLEICVHLALDNQEELCNMIKANGGSITDQLTKRVTCVVANDEVAAEEEDEVLVEAKQCDVPGVKPEWVKDSVENGELQRMEGHILWGRPRHGLAKQAAAATKTKFIQKMGVAMDADVGELAEKAHVLVEKNKGLVYSEMLNKTDMVTGANSFYTMHLLESDAAGKKNYWIFRKWGRIGVSQGGTKVEDFGSCINKAKAEFLKQYREKTGNDHGHGKDDFVVHPGLFVRVDVEHKALGKGKQSEGSGQQKGEEGGGDQPLGKLSKVQIEKGDKVLDRIEALLNEQGDADPTPQVKTKYMAFSAEYYTLIPHDFGAKKPPPINNPDLLGAEKALLQFYLRMGFEELGGEETVSLTPISGVMELELPPTLEKAAKPVCGIKDINSCTSKGATMAKKKAGKPVQEMDKELYGAILLYTSNAIYKDLNKVLRDEDRFKVERYFPYLRMLFEACARLPTKPKTLWRGIGVDLFPTYKVGSTVIWWGVSSTTSDKKVAENFMNGCGDGATFLTIDTVTACDISEVSFYANEAESLLLPGTQLEVLSAEKVGGKSRIHLKEVGRVVS